MSRADFSHIPYNVLGIISNRIINEVRGVYDICSPQHHRMGIDVPPRTPESLLARRL